MLWLKKAYHRLLKGLRGIFDIGACSRAQRCFGDILSIWKLNLKTLH